MATWRDLLTEAIKDDGRDHRAISLAAGQGPTFIRDLIKRNARPNIEAFIALAKALKRPVAALVGEDLDAVRPQVPLVGRVGAGGEVVPSEADDVDYVDMPPGGSPDLEALEVVNGSMQPVYRSGDYLFVSPADEGTPLDKLVGLECVVQCEDDRRLVKVLRKGTGPGLWRLESYNPAVDDIEGVRVVKAMPVRHVTRRLSV